MRSWLAQEPLRQLSPGFARETLSTGSCVTSSFSRSDEFFYWTSFGLPETVSLTIERQIRMANFSSSDTKEIMLRHFLFGDADPFSG